MTLIELADPWHPQGYRIRVPMTVTGEIPELVGTAIGDLTEPVDQVTHRRPSDRDTGHYVRTGTAEDGVPVFGWQWF